MRRIPFSMIILAIASTLFFWHRQTREAEPVAERTSTLENPHQDMIKKEIVAGPAPSKSEQRAPAAKTIRTPASEKILSDILPAKLRGRAKFEDIDSIIPGRKFFTVKIDGADLIGASITLDSKSDRVINSHLPRMPAEIPPFPNGDTEQMKDKIQAQFATGDLEPEEPTLLRKLWIPSRQSSKLQPAVEFLVRSKNKETKQIQEEVFQFDPSNEQLLTRYEPTKH